MQSSHISLGACPLVAIIVAWAGPVAAVDPPAASVPVTAAWTASPLREVAGQLARLAGMPVVLDRRVDPTTPITLQASGEPVDAVAASIATEAGAEAAALRSLVRIGSAPHLARCVAGEQARSRDLTRLTAAQRRLLEAPVAWAWPAGSRPRDLVADAAADQGISLDGLDQVPHDHFPAGDLAPLPLADRIDLVLAHFDLRASWARGTGSGPPRGRIVPLPDAKEVQLPVAKPPRPVAPAVGRQVYTLQLAAPLDEALAAITKQLGLSLSLDTASLEARGISPREIVRANVRSASRDELLDAIVKPLALSWQVERDTLRVWADAP